MPQEPKKRHSRARQGKRRASISLVQANPTHRMKKFYALLEQDKIEKQAKSIKEKPASSENEED